MTNDAPGNGSDATLREFASGQKLFNRYTLKKTLGRGGMGIVWLARDEELERDVALKFLPDLIIHDRAVLSDLKRETRRSLELTHKNIVRIYDFVHDQTSGCISMEYVDGDTLSNLRADKPRKIFEPDELTDWISQLCDALDYAHTHARIVHRDLKPTNLMVNQRSDLKVADFGIARSLSDSVSKLTMQYGKSGTLVYMSPQQLDGERGNHLDDVYSLGASIYELLTSKPPFYSGNIDRQIHERTPPPMNHRREELEIEGVPIDEIWEKLVAACLQKDPARRPQSAAEIAEWLEAPPQRKSGWLKFPTSRKTHETTHKTRTKTEPPRTKRVREKKLRLAVARTIAAANDDLRAAALGVISASKTTLRGAGRAFLTAATLIFRAIAAGGALSANMLRASERVLLSLIKETFRGAALVVIPAAAIAACIWYLANRPHVAAIAPALQPTTRAMPESKPPPTREGGLKVDTVPAGATVIVDGEIIRESPANLSNLAAGKHHLQIVLQDYITEEREVEVKDGEITSQGVITLHARTQPQPGATPNVAQETPSVPAPPAGTEAAEISPSGGSSPTPGNNPRLVFAPPPTYPSQARQKRVTGSGSFRISFDAEGKVISVNIVESTGQRVLDTNTINTLKRWRATPGTPWTIVVPIIYTKPEARPHSQENSAE